MNSTSVLDIAAGLAVAASPIEAAALEGLSARFKHLPSWLFYDEAGSRLFEEITRLPEYYLTSREHSILSLHSPEILAAASGIENERLSIVELGAGSATKTLVLLRALVARQARALYIPIDVSAAALEWAARNVHAAVPGVALHPICAEITHETPLELPAEGRRMALYIGSSIGNFDPGEAVDLLRWLRSQLAPADTLLLGTDMVKPAEPLLAAYNDKAGVTAAFNKNILARLNRELGANFELDAFEHRAVWNIAASRMEMHLDSKRNQIVRIPALDRSFSFQRGESIHTESSYKFTQEAVEDILMQSGFTLQQSWYDHQRWFGVHLASVIDSGRLTEEDAEVAA